MRECWVGKEELVSINKARDMSKETLGMEKRRPGMKKTKIEQHQEGTLKPQTARVYGVRTV